MRFGIVVYVVVFNYNGFETFTLTDDDPSFSIDRDSSLNSYKRIKRGLVKESVEIITKGQKYAALIWRYNKANRFLLKGATLVKEPDSLKWYTQT